MILLQANQIARYFGADTLFENIHLEVASKARIGLVGRNGAGKSTLLKIIANIEAPDVGQVIKNKQATLGYLAQDTGLDSTETIWNEMLKAFDTVRQMEARMRDVEVAIGETPESDSRYASLLKNTISCSMTLMNRMAMAMKMRFAVFYMDLNSMRAFMIKKSVHYPVVRKPVLPWHECY